MNKFIKIAFVVAIATVAGYNVYQSQSVMIGMSDFALANVEALAQTEIDMSRGYNLVEKSETCSVCKWTGQDNDYCNVHSQLPDCY